MMHKLADWLLNFASQSGKNLKAVQAGIFASLVLPIFIIAAWRYAGTKNDLTELALSRRESVAQLAATGVKEKFDRIVDLGISFATRVQFRKLIEAGKWDEAIKILGSAPKDFPYIDTVGLFDTSGTVWAVTPPIPEAIGQNFAYRDYYKGVSKNWQPYVSEVFKRAPEPRYNVVSVAVPIKSDATPGRDQKILGILLLTINLDTIFDWTREIEIGGGGFVYFVDRNGNAAGHPKFSSQNEVVNFSEVSAVKKALKGEKGIEVSYSQVEKEERVFAYEPVPRYGWGVVVEETASTAFAARDRNLRVITWVYAVTILFNCLIAYFIMRFGHLVNLYRQKEKAFLESISDGVVAIDRYWNIVLWNKAASAISGWRREEAIGKPLRQVIRFIRQRDQKENISFIEDTMLYGEARPMENDTVLITKDGREVPVGDSAAPVFDQGGKVDGAIIVFRDISEEIELRKKDLELQKSKEDFLFQTVHDLRSSAVIINLVLQKLSSPEFLAKYPEGKEDVEMIKEADARLLKLIHDLLEIGRGGREGMALARERVDLSRLVKEVLRELRPAIIERGISTEYDAQESLPKVWADAGKVKEILENLLDNAVKYNNAGGSIMVSHGVEAGVVKTAIRDTGIGIASSDLGKLFQPYFRAGTAAGVQGTGLGLYIVKKLVEKMAGKVEIESAPGRGTAVTVSLPQVPKD